MTDADVHTTDAPAQRRPNQFALALVGAGAILGILAFSTLDWFDSNVGLISGSRSTAGDIGDLLDQLISFRRAFRDRNLYHLGLADYYYSWLGWVLLAAAVVVAAVAALPTQEGGPVRLLGALLALLGIGATFWALDVYRPTAHDPRVARGPGYVDFLRHAGWGVWAALAAFVLIGIGSLLGPRHAAASAS